MYLIIYCTKAYRSCKKSRLQRQYVGAIPGGRGAANAVDGAGQHSGDQEVDPRNDLAPGATGGPSRSGLRYGWTGDELPSERDEENVTRRSHLTGASTRLAREHEFVGMQAPTWANRDGAADPTRGTQPDYVVSEESAAKGRDERFRFMLTFRIDGDLRFISHLDTVRLFRRACARAGLPVRYSQGFNPQPRIVLPFNPSVCIPTLDKK